MRLRAAARPAGWIAWNVDTNAGNTDITHVMFGIPVENALGRVPDSAQEPPASLRNYMRSAFEMAIDREQTMR